MATHLPPVTTPVTKPEKSPTSTIAAGLAIIFLGTLFTLADGFLGHVGLLVISLGMLIGTIGTVAAGVRLGMSWVAYDRDQQG